MSELYQTFGLPCSDEDYRQAVQHAERAARVTRILGTVSLPPAPAYLSIFQPGRERNARVRQCAEAILDGLCPQFAPRQSEEVA